MPRRKTKQTKFIFLPPDEQSIADEDTDVERGVYLEQEDILVLYKALRYYQPAEKDEHRHSLLLEEFEEMLAADFLK
jgi:hypothetical protein